MGKNTTKQEKAKRNLEYARAHRKPTRAPGRFGRPKFHRPAESSPAPSTSQASGSAAPAEEAAPAE